ncbi:MAG TPA: GntR family transcriptional regulator [Propionibacteriaceae bacterium]|nr:GntR family transcriptional regulator [Propionibacteriaceae bacterium]
MTDRLVLPEAVQPALSAVVVQMLREMISQGQFQPGQHLKEAELAAALKVSRGPVREALTQLEVEGHVELRRHRGAFVSRLTRADVEEVHTLRVAIEALAAERACLRMGAAEFATMDSVLAEMATVAAGEVHPAEVVRLDLQFHDIIYASSQHQRVQRVWNSLRSQVSFFLHTRNVNFPDFAAVGHPEHLELRTALALGDPAAARAAVEQHLSGAYTRLRKLNLPDPE